MYVGMFDDSLFNDNLETLSNANYNITIMVFFIWFIFYIKR